MYYGRFENPPCLDRPYLSRDLDLIYFRWDTRACVDNYGQPIPINSAVTTREPHAAVIFLHKLPRRRRGNRAVVGEKKKRAIGERTLDYDLMVIHRIIIVTITGHRISLPSHMNYCSFF